MFAGTDEAGCDLWQPVPADNNARRASEDSRLNMCAIVANEDWLKMMKRQKHGERFQLDSERPWVSRHNDGRVLVSAIFGLEDTLHRSARSDSGLWPFRWIPSARIPYTAIRLSVRALPPADPSAGECPQLFGHFASSR